VNEIKRITRTFKACFSYTFLLHACACEFPRGIIIFNIIKHIIIQLAWRYSQTILAMLINRSGMKEPHIQA